MTYPLTEEDLGGNIQWRDFDRLNRRNHLPRKVCISATAVIKAFPSAGIAFANGKVVPIEYHTATGLLCRCGAEIDLGRDEYCECPNECGRFFMREAPDVIRCARPESL